jgi:hypothetical protein
VGGKERLVVAIVAIHDLQKTDELLLKVWELEEQKLCLDARIRLPRGSVRLWLAALGFVNRGKLG